MNQRDQFQLEMLKVANELSDRMNRLYDKQITLSIRELMPWQAEKAIIVDCPSCGGSGDGEQKDVDVFLRCQECEKEGAVAILCGCGDVAHEDHTVESVNCDGEPEQSYYCEKCHKEGEQDEQEFQSRRLRDGQGTQEEILQRS